MLIPQQQVNDPQLRTSSQRIINIEGIQQSDGEFRASPILTRDTTILLAS